MAGITFLCTSPCVAHFPWDLWSLMCDRDPRDYERREQTRCPKCGRSGAVSNDTPHPWYLSPRSQKCQAHGCSAQLEAEEVDAGGERLSSARALTFFMEMLSALYQHQPTSSQNHPEPDRPGPPMAHTASLAMRGSTAGIAASAVMSPGKAPLGTSDSKWRHFRLSQLERATGI